MAPWAWFLFGFLACAAVAALVMRRLLAIQHRRTTLAIERARRAEHLAELGSMTSGLAHEIKNPLSTLSLNAQLLGEELTDNQHLSPEERHRLVRRTDVLRREADRVKGILTDFLQFAGQLRLDPSPHDLNILVDELADFFAPQAQNAGVRLHVTPAPEPAIAYVDSALFKQAMLNLLLNANQAMDGQNPANRPKELMIRIEKHPEPLDVLPPTIPKNRSTPDNNKPNASDVVPPRTAAAAISSSPREAWAVHVTDTGPGIAPDHASKIFSPYYSTRKGGTGLGLPTSKRIIEEHGGTITVHSEPGQGTDFVLILPAADKSSPTIGR